MNPDITRDTFDREKHFARVLLQQGRVMLDADGNEQTAILLHLIRTLARDVFGAHGGPDKDHSGFLIESIPGNGKDFKIGPGRYYVDGILCENEPAGRWEPGGGTGCTYLHQPDYQPDEAELPAGSMVYLDVWERPVSYLEDGSMREIALGGPDSAIRSKVVWQVRFAKGDPSPEQLVAGLQPAYRGLLRARVEPSDASTDPCILSPESRYRGAENQLYRVEVHTAGKAGEATFKWSRDDGSVCFAIRTLGNGVAQLESLGPDNRRTLKVGDWVEVVDELLVQRGEWCPLARVTDVQPDDVSVLLEATGDLPGPDLKRSVPLLLRRWDYQGGDPASGRPALADGDGALEITEGGWWTLEDGVQIQFVPAPTNEANTYRTGDYWLIPARVATGDVEWPVDPKQYPPPNPPQVPQPPHGVWHHYAQLAYYDGTNFNPLRSFLH
ncbi:MAG: DUF6519 domain-containing protein [Gemmatimonadales bacterium]